MILSIDWANMYYISKFKISRKQSLTANSIWILHINGSQKALASQTDKEINTPTILVT